MTTTWTIDPVWGDHTPAGDRGEVAGVAVDSRDRVYVLTRFPARVLVFASDGTFLRSWGENTFTERAHGITVGPDDSIYCVDDALHTVRRFSRDGELLVTLGRSGISSRTGYCEEDGVRSIKRGGAPFNRPTNVGIAPNSDLFVSDGYGNARIHRFTADGDLVTSWGEPGSGRGQFCLPHDVIVAPDGRVLVADRENDRIQLFDESGTFLDEWLNVQRPTALAFGRDGHLYVSELAWHPGQSSFRNGPIASLLPGRVSVLTTDGEVVDRISSAADGANAFRAPHAIALDSHGDVYVGEVAHSFLGGLGIDADPGPDLQKLSSR